MSEPEMVKRVAQHVADFRNLYPDDRRCIELARLVIAAMREPTDAMITAGEAQCGSYGNSEFAWQNMIDAALAD